MEGRDTASWRKSSYSGNNGANCVEVGAARWQKSSHSGNNGGTCVEVGAARWQKSSHSGCNGGDCVEVGLVPSAVRVRDTKDRQGPALGFSADAWRAFTDRIKNEAD